jgi:hypothetical protein
VGLPSLSHFIVIQGYAKSREIGGIIRGDLKLKEGKITQGVTIQPL